MIPVTAPDDVVLAKLPARIIQKLVITDGCWLWTGAGRVAVPSKRRGYGHVRWDGPIRPIAQVVWEIATDLPFPAGMQACHTCDNPPCARPSHIWAGTQTENQQDSIAKGRKVVATGYRNGSRLYPERRPRGAGCHCRPCRGEANGRAVLTVTDVLEIREAKAVGASTRVLAARYHVNVSTINRAASGRRWAEYEALGLPEPGQEPDPEDSPRYWPPTKGKEARTAA